MVIELTQADRTNLILKVSKNDAGSWAIADIPGWLREADGHNEIVEDYSSNGNLPNLLARVLAEAQKRQASDR